MSEEYDEEGGFGFEEESVLDTPKPKRLNKSELTKALGSVSKRKGVKVEKYRVICTGGPKNSNKCQRGDYDEFKAPDESHARRMFVQKYKLDPQGAGLTVLYNFKVVPKFDDYRPHAPYTSETEKERLHKYQQDRGKVESVKKSNGNTSAKP